jgi:hypothetical protein
MAFYGALSFVAMFTVVPEVRENFVSCAVQVVRARICCHSRSHLQILKDGDKTALSQRHRTQFCAPLVDVVNDPELS